MISGGFTKIDADTMQVLLGLPNALVQPYLFLLSRANLTRGSSCHWGEVAAACDRSQTQTHSALKSLAELGLISCSGKLWKSCGKSSGESIGNPAGNQTGNQSETLRVINRKPAMTETIESVLGDEDLPLNERSKELKEFKEEELVSGLPPEVKTATVGTPEILEGQLLESKAAGVIAELDGKEKRFVYSFASAGHRRLIYQVLAAGGVAVWREFVNTAKLSRKASSAALPTLMVLLLEDLRVHGADRVLRFLRRAVSETSAKSSGYEWQNYTQWIAETGTPLATGDGGVLEPGEFEFNGASFRVVRVDDGMVFLSDGRELAMERTVNWRRVA